MKFKLLLIWAFLMKCHAGYAQTSTADSLLTVLKAELGKEYLYDLEKEKTIKHLQNRLHKIGSANFENQYKLLSQIFEEYRSFRFDSAFTYVKKMIRLSEKFKRKDHLVNSQILLGTTLLNTGFYKEAFDALTVIDTGSLSYASKSDYFILRARLYAGIGSYDNDAHFARAYYKQSENDFRNAESAVPANSFEKTIDLAFLPTTVKGKKLTANYFYNFINSHHLTKHSVAMVATRISYAFSGQDRVLFLALAAINDLQSSTKETYAIFLLGQELFKLNRASDAYIFIQHAIKNAKFYGARNRAGQIESVLPLVASKLLDEKQHEKDKLLIGFLVFLIIACILVFIVIIYRKQIKHVKANENIIRQNNKELEKINSKLWEASRIKEELIGLFFKTTSSYIETLDKVTRKAQHSIKLEKYKEANAILSDVKIEKEKSRLYETLDSVFLTLFPNFVVTFNALLKKEDQSWPKKGELLTATLRIFALMRLGVNDLETIAKILDYSVSTVYTYKVRTKAKALVPAEDFERRIMEIKFIDEL
jgi:hypothetical protein